MDDLLCRKHCAEYCLVEIATVITMSYVQLTMFLNGYCISQGLVGNSTLKRVNEESLLLFIKVWACSVEPRWMVHYSGASNSWEFIT